MASNTMSSGQQVLIELRKMIISGELPGGLRLAEIPTAEMLGVSRQPIRVAFRLLEQEGLLLKNPTRGYTVREISPKLIQDALEVHARKKKLAEDVDLGIIAKNTSGFSGADLENVLNEAALLAARNNQQNITMKNVIRIGMTSKKI